MLENIVRHIEMGEGALEAALERLEGDRLHDPLDDDLARGRLHPGPLHGRHHRAALPRVRGHDRRRDPRLGLRLALADADALQPVPQAPHAKEKRHGRLYQATERVFDGMLALLRARTLERGAARTGATTMALLGRWSSSRRSGSSCTFPKGFLPSEDTGQVFGFTEARPGHLVRGDGRAPAGRSRRSSGRTRTSTDFMSSCGNRGSDTRRQLGHRVRAPEAARRAQALAPTRSSSACGRSSRRSPASAPSSRSRRRSGSAARSRKSQYQYTLQDPDTDELYKSAPAPRAEDARRSRGSRTSRATCSSATRRSTSTIDRDKAAALGVTPQQIEDALYTAYGSRQISTIYAPNNEYQVIMELAPAVPARPGVALAALRALDDGRPRAALGGRATSSATRRAAHRRTTRGSSPSVTISFNLEPGVALGDAVAAVNKLARRRCRRPSRRASRARRRRSSPRIQGLGLLLLVAILVIYIVLGILYESFIHPLTILSALPFAGFGALADAPDLPDGALDLRVRRHHHARRPREEERHHDGRLRDRGAARRGQGADGRRSTRPASSASARS